MLTKILKPYRISVSDKARAAGFDDRAFPNKKSALVYVKRIRAKDPDFRPPMRITFRYFDTATGALYACRADYELEQERARHWRAEQEAAQHQTNHSQP